MIENSNPAIARKIINVKGTFDHLNSSFEQSKYRDTVQRLERFSTYQRMASFSQRRSRIKT